MKEPEVTLKNTKAEILDALNAALAREVAAKQNKPNPVVEEKKKTEAKVVEATKAAVQEEVFSERLIKKFNDLELAIRIEESRLTELYGVEKELQSLTLAVNAGKDEIERIEADKKLQLADSQAAIMALKADYAQKSEDLKAEYEGAAKALKIQRDREAEEYSYQLKRDRTLENNRWADEKAKREADLAEKEKKAEQILQEAEEKAAYLSELEQKVAGIPELIDKEREAAVRFATGELNRDFEYKSALLEKDYTNKVAQLEFQVEALTQEVKKASAFSDSLQAKLDKAYSELRELAEKTVETNGSVRFIGNSVVEK
ncbi:MAG: hypothetical protein LBG81_09350 [Coriobacteriaceae bacterium]|jgi:hypothetical protein|nr:hypothetical protein [Coriobacteriaceae bacterium]